MIFSIVFLSLLDVTFESMKQRIWKFCYCLKRPFNVEKRILKLIKYIFLSYFSVSLVCLWGLEGVLLLDEPP